MASHEQSPTSKPRKQHKDRRNLFFGGVESSTEHDAEDVEK